MLYFGCLLWDSGRPWSLRCTWPSSEWLKASLSWLLIRATSSTSSKGSGARLRSFGGICICTETSKAPPRTSKHTTMPQASAPKHPATPADIGSLLLPTPAYTRTFYTSVNCLSEACCPMNSDSTLHPFPRPRRPALCEVEVHQV